MWSWWEVLTALLLVVSNFVAWWSLPVFSRNGHSPWIFIASVVVAVFMYMSLSIVDGTHPTLRRIALVLAFGAVIPFAFLEEPLVGAGAAIVGAVVAEAGAMWTANVRHAFQRPRFGFMAKRGLPFYFSAVSIVLTAILFVSPLGTRVLRNPLSERTLRNVLVWTDPFLKPILGFSLQSNVDTIVAQTTETQDPEIIAQARQSLAQRLGVALRGSDDLASVLASYLDQQLGGVQERLGVTYHLAFLLSAFLLFRFLAIPFTWISLLLIGPFMEVLKATGAVASHEEPTVRTVLQWKNV